MKETLYSTFGPMLEVADSYFRRAFDPEDRIVYRSAVGLFAEQTRVSGDLPLADGGSFTAEDFKALQCSEFAMAVCSGIPYELSRYVQEKNERLWWGFKTDGSVPVDYSHRIAGYLQEEDYLTAAEFAQYCFLKGWLIPFDPAHNAMLPGDVLFWSRTQENYAKVFRNVGHVAILLDKREDGYSCIESGRTRRRLFDGEPTTLEMMERRYETDSPTFYARLPIPVSRYSAEQILSREEHARGAAAGKETEIFHYGFGGGLPVGFYSLNWEDESTSPLILRLKGTSKEGAEIVQDLELAGGHFRHRTFFAEFPVKELLLAKGEGRFNVSRVRMHSGYVI